MPAQMELDDRNKKNKSVEEDLEKGSPLSPESKSEGGGLFHDIYFPVRLLGECLGLIQRRRSSKFPRLSSSWTSDFRCVLLRIFVAVLLLFTIYETLYEIIRVTITHQLVATEKAHYIIMLQYSCKSFQGLLCFVVVVAKSGQLSQYMESFCQVEFLYEKHRKSLKRYVPLYLLAIVFVFTMDAGTEIVFFKDYDGPRPVQDTSTIAEKLRLPVVCVGMIFLLLMQMFTEVTFVVLVSIMRRCFQTLTKEISSVDEVEEQEEELEKRIQHIRFTYWKLLTIADQMEALLSPTIFTSLVVNIVNLCVNVYWLFLHGFPQDTDELEEFTLLVLSSVASFVRIAALCNSAHKMAHKADETRISIYTIRLTNKHDGIKHEVLMLSQLLNAHPINISASHYVSINRELITAALGIVITYMALMLDVFDFDQ